jgi:tagaturonate reductase
METLNRRTWPDAGAPLAERVLQIGEGKFIRGFADRLLQELALQGLFAGSVVLTPARVSGKSKIESLREQDGLFTVWTRGMEGGNVVDRLDVVSAVSRVVDPFQDWPGFLACAEQRAIDIVVSNTTEAGIVYTPTERPVGSAPASFPARLTAYLFHRFTHLAGDPDAGMVILPTELIEDNGTTLRSIVLRHAEDWELGAGFAEWVIAHNSFCNTLVDRIVPGTPDAPEEAFARLGYRDAQLIVAEPFHLWAIETDQRAMRRLPFDQSTLNVVYTDSMAPYRIQKLRVLNGTHIFLTPLGLLLGCATVREAVTHLILGPAIRTMLYEVIVQYSELDEPTLRRYADTVLDRFLNPYIAHRLSDITLGALGKFRIRLLPVLLRYAEAHGRPPAAMSLSLAALLELYRPGAVAHATDDTEIATMATAHWIAAASTKEAVTALLADERIWGRDLTTVHGLTAEVTGAAQTIAEGRLESALTTLLRSER